MRARARGFFQLVTVAGVVLAEVAAGWAAEPGAPLSPEAQEAVKLLDDKDAYSRQLGFMRLEALREPASATVIRSYLTSKDPDTRAFSVRALAAVEGIQAVPVLLERLRKDKHPRVRLAALFALEPLEDPTVMPALIERLRDRHPEVRMGAVDAVSRFDHPQAREAILNRWRRERHRDVRRVLRDVMKRLGSP